MNLQELLGLSLPPVAIAFRPTVATGVPHVGTVGPAPELRQGFNLEEAALRLPLLPRAL